MASSAFFFAHWSLHDDTDRAHSRKQCCGSQNEPKWKREVVRDHKFDYVDIDEFYDPSCGARMEYMLIYVFVLKSFAVYIADLWSAGKSPWRIH